MRSCCLIPTGPEGNLIFENRHKQNNSDKVWRYLERSPSAAPLVCYYTGISQSLTQQASGWSATYQLMTWIVCHWWVFSRCYHQRWVCQLSFLCSLCSTSPYPPQGEDSAGWRTPCFWWYHVWFLQETYIHYIYCIYVPTLALALSWKMLLKQLCDPEVKPKLNFDPEHISTELNRFSFPVKYLKYSQGVNGFEVCCISCLDQHIQIHRLILTCKKRLLDYLNETLRCSYLLWCYSPEKRQRGSSRYSLSSWSRLGHLQKVDRHLSLLEEELSWSSRTGRPSFVVDEHWWSSC